MENSIITVFYVSNIFAILQPNIVDGIINSSTQLPRRIIKETQQLLTDKTPGISAVPDEGNARHFKVKISGPPNTPYEGGVFELDLTLPNEYPDKAPEVKFVTKIYHPNISKEGRICLDTIKCKWSPAFQIRTVLLSIQALLADPNPDSPLEGDIAALWKKDKKRAWQNARDYTAQWAKGTM